MQAYGIEFAAVYNRVWNGFSNTFAPIVSEFVKEPPERSLLDLCCGTGRFCGHFLEQGWRVTGLDSSEGMLRWARVNNRRYADEGTFSIVKADAASFRLDRRFGLVTSIFDAINHLEGEESLAGCFSSAHEALLPGGLFVFDINTRRGLRTWTTVDVQDDEELFLLKRGMYVEELGRAWLEVIGFVDSGGGKYDRFREIVFNYAWSVSRVAELLGRAGFSDIEIRKAKTGLPVAVEPELEERVFFVARK